MIYSEIAPLYWLLCNVIFHRRSLYSFYLDITLTHWIDWKMFMQQWVFQPKYLPNAFLDRLFRSPILIASYAIWKPFMLLGQVNAWNRNIATLLALVGKFGGESPQKSIARDVNLSPLWYRSQSETQPVEKLMSKYRTWNESTCQMGKHMFMQHYMYIPSYILMIFTSALSTTNVQKDHAALLFAFSTQYYNMVPVHRTCSLRI